MIAADWKHGIFPRKTSSRPRYSVTSRDASMAGGVTGRCEETLFLFFLVFFSFSFFFPLSRGWIRGAAGVGDGVRVRVGELLLLRSPVAPEEVRFALWTPHKSGDCWAERNTPTWSLGAGLPKQFHVTDLRADAHYRGNQRTATRHRHHSPCGGSFSWWWFAEPSTPSVENKALLCNGHDDVYHNEMKLKSILPLHQLLF